MMQTPKTHFVRQYGPGKQARVALKNGRILDVVNGRYFDAGTSVILQGGKIVSMQGSAGEPTDITSDFSIDLGGKTVLPSLYNTHMHLATAGPTIMSLAEYTQSTSTWICRLYVSVRTFTTPRTRPLPSMRSLRFVSSWIWAGR